MGVVNHTWSVIGLVFFANKSANGFLMTGFSLASTAPEDVFVFLSVFFGVFLTVVASFFSGFVFLLVLVLGSLACGTASVEIFVGVLLLMASLNAWLLFSSKCANDCHT
jgi:hypothetical protein